MKRVTGGCLCGAVKLRASLPDDRIQACHCGQCQRWTGGGPLFTVRVADLEIEGDEAISTFRMSEWGERAFCGTCGSTLWWRMQGRPIVFVAAGLLDDQTSLTVAQEIFVDHRPDWLPPWAAAEQTTEAEELAGLHEFLENEAAAGVQP